MADRFRSVTARLGQPLRPEALDAVLAACLVVIAGLTALVADERGVEGSAAPHALWSWVLVLIPAVAVGFRTRAPLVATPVTVVAQMAIWVTGLASAIAAPLVMIYSAAATGSASGRRIAMASVVALGATATAGWLTAPDVGIDLAALSILASTIVFLLGSAAAAQRSEAAALATSLAVTRLERDSELERAATGERQRIARDLHDLVGHSLSVIVVRAEAAQRVAPSKPEAASDALAAVAETARSSLGEVRRVLFALRVAGETSELMPLPGLGDVESLVADVADSTGMATTCHVTGTNRADLSPTVAAAAYRIVQESLTNAIKHAGPGVKVAVDIEAEEDQLMVRIDDNGRGQSALQARTTGSGLIGMTERAEILGGTLIAASRPGGGFRVLATLPLAAVGVEGARP